jgi:hypothetical protein
MIAGSDGVSIDSIDSLKGETINTINNIMGTLLESHPFVINIVTFSTKYKNETII